MGQENEAGCGRHNFMCAGTAGPGQMPESAEFGAQTAAAFGLAMPAGRCVP
jgi:hypothetical protein